MNVVDAPVNVLPGVGLVMVAEIAPAPLSGICWVEEAALRELSVNERLSVRVPMVVGVKSTAKMQLAPSARVKAIEELGVVWVQVEVGSSQVKFEVERLGLSPVAGRLKVSVALPLLAMIAVSGPSAVSVVPCSVPVGKVSEGGVASGISDTALFV